MDTAECGKFGLYITLEKKKINTLKLPIRMLSPDQVAVGLSMLLPNEVQGCPIVHWIWKCTECQHRRFWRKVKLLHIGSGLTPHFSKQLCDPPCPLMSPEPKLEIRTECWMTLPEKIFSGMFEATEVCASKRLSFQTTSTQGTLPITSKAAAITVTNFFKTVVKAPTYVMHTR